MTLDLPLALNDLMNARYGEEAVLPQTSNETLATLLAHRSIRRYQATLLPSGTLELLVAAAQSASTSSNLQTWSVIAVSDQAHKDRLAELAGNQRYISEAPVFLVWLADLARLKDLAVQRGLEAEALDYTEMFVMATVDATLAAQNAAVAAESLGLGIVYIGGMRNQPEAVAEVLELPEGTFAVFGMCVGYADESHPASIKPRLPQAAVLHHERYDRESQATAIAHYGEVMHDFYTAQQMKVEGSWVEHSLNRVATPASLGSRHRLREALERRGFRFK